MVKTPLRFSRRVVLRGGFAGLAAMMGPSFLLTSCSSEGGPPPATAAIEPPFGGVPIDGPKLVSRLAEIGPLGDPDANGVKLPPGFSVRIIAQSNKKPIESSDYLWHIAPDGGATFLLDDGGYVYVSNSEVPIAGGVGALRFDAAGKLVDAYSILAMTNVNCAGGPTPWGTWLSCEEVSRGRVFECDPRGEHEAILRPALGIFKHEAATIDRVKHHVYLTEDEEDGCFYRFVPEKLNRFGFADISSGKLQVAEVGMDGSVKWIDVPDPQFEGAIATRKQVASATLFDGGEGIWYHDGIVYFSAKGETRVYAYDTITEKLTVIYDGSMIQTPVLTGVDNITVSCCGDVLVAEDTGDMQIVVILPSGELRPIVQIVGHDKSEITGPAFDPSGTRLYFSSQRGNATSGGTTYEITGPFHAPA